MKLSQLAAKPQLVQVSIDDEATIAEFGEAVEFQTWDRQPLDVFMKLASANQENASDMINIVRTMILDEKGKEIITNENMLPSTLLLKAISKIVETLGK
jgi:hypothetical protein